jgi:hypothetical protein
MSALEDKWKREAEERKGVSKETVPDDFHSDDEPSRMPRYGPQAGVDLEFNDMTAKAILDGPPLEIGRSGMPELRTKPSDEELDESMARMAARQKQRAAELAQWYPPEIFTPDPHQRKSPPLPPAMIFRSPILSDNIDLSSLTDSIGPASFSVKAANKICSMLAGQIGRKKQRLRFYLGPQQLNDWPSTKAALSQYFRADDGGPLESWADCWRLGRSEGAALVALGQLQASYELSDFLKSSLDDQGRLETSLLSSGIDPRARFEYPELDYLCQFWKPAVVAPEKRQLLCVHVGNFLLSSLAWLSADSGLCRALSQDAIEENDFRLGCLLGLSGQALQKFVGERSGELVGRFFKPSRYHETDWGELTHQRNEVLAPYPQLRAFHGQIAESTTRPVTWQEHESSLAAQRAIGKQFQPGYTKSHDDEAFAMLTQTLVATRAALMSVIASTISHHLAKTDRIVLIVRGDLLFETTLTDVPPPTLLVSAISEAIAQSFDGFPLRLRIGVGSDWQEASREMIPEEPLPEWVKLKKIAIPNGEELLEAGSIVPAATFSPDSLRKHLREGAVIAADEPERVEKF